MNIYYFTVSIGHEFWNWLNLVVLAQGLSGGYRPDEKGLQSPESWTKCGGSSSKCTPMTISRMPQFLAGCWLGGLIFSPHGPRFMTWQLASLRASNLGERKKNHQAYYVLVSESQCHFCFILLVRGGLLSPVHTQGRRIRLHFLVSNNFWIFYITRAFKITFCSSVQKSTTKQFFAEWSSQSLVNKLDMGSDSTLRYIGPGLLPCDIRDNTR